MKSQWALLVISTTVAWAQVPASPDTVPPEPARLPEWGQQFVDALEIRPGNTVADVGAGRGVYLPVWSVAVGSTGHVIAEDIDKPSLDWARKKTDERIYPNVEFVLGTEKDAMLPARRADLIVVIDAYHHFTYPADMLASLSKALKTDGRLAIIDFDKTDKPTRGSPPPGHVRLNRDEAINEIVSNGFRLVRTRDFMQRRQYIAVFVRDPQKRDHSADPPNETKAWKSQSAIAGR